MSRVLDQLPFAHGIPTRQISAENPTGEKGRACTWDPVLGDPMLPHAHVALDMGRGWKVRPFITLDPGETNVLADIQGPGCINEFFITAATDRLSELVLRIYWDDEQTPSVECPLGAFFAMGHDDHRHGVNSVPVIVAPRNACNCYWQMPLASWSPCGRPRRSNACPWQAGLPVRCSFSNPPATAQRSATACPLSMRAATGCFTYPIAEGIGARAG